MTRRKRSRGDARSDSRSTKKGPADRHRSRIEATLDELDEAVSNEDLEHSRSLLEDVRGQGSQAAYVLVSRLVEDRAAHPPLAFHLLEAVSGTRRDAKLRHIAREPKAPDTIRFLAQHYLDWPRQGTDESRLTFLETLREPDAALVEVAATSARAWPTQLEIFVSVLDYLVLLPGDRRLAVVTGIIDGLGSVAAPAIHALLHVDDPPVQSLVISALGRIKKAESVGALRRLARTARDQDVRRVAEETANRIATQPGDGGADAPDDETARFRERFPDLVRAFVTAVYADGRQSVHVERAYIANAFLLATVAFDDVSGLFHAAGHDHATSLDITMIETAIEVQGTVTIDTDLATIRGVLELALEANARAGTPIPMAFEVWEPFVHDEYPPRPDEPITIPVLDDAGFAGRHDLVRSSGELLDHDFFWIWGLDSEATLIAMDGVEPPEGGEWTDEQYGPLIERLVDPEMRDRLRRSLQRQAWLLDQDEDYEARDAALAVSASLADASQAELTQHPFLRRMVEESVADVMDDMTQVLDELQLDEATLGALLEGEAQLDERQLKELMRKLQIDEREFQRFLEEFPADEQQE